MMKIAGVAGFALLAFVAGGATYLVTLGLVWGERISRGDLVAVLYWFGLAYALVALPVFVTSFLLVHLLRRLLQLRGRGPALWVFPLVGLLGGWAPTYALVRTWGGGLRTLLEPEALLFYSFFGGAGLCFGLSWWLVFGRERGRVEEPRKRHW